MIDARVAHVNVSHLPQFDPHSCDTIARNVEDELTKPRILIAQRHTELLRHDLDGLLCRRPLSCAPVTGRAASPGKNLRKSIALLPLDQPCPWP